MEAVDARRFWIPAFAGMTSNVSDVVCAGESTHRGDVETSARTHLVFPYRGTYVRHVGGDEAVADASQVLFFNAGDGYQVSHPIPAAMRASSSRRRHAAARDGAEGLLREGDNARVPHAAPAHRSARAGAGGHARHSLRERHRRVAGSRRPRADAGAARARAAHDARRRRERRRANAWWIARSSC
jgi:hypothetical protein